MMIGAHVPDQHPLAEAEDVGADCVQLFVGPPQSWKKPPPRADAETLKSSPLPVYVHAPYLINVASPNNRVRIPSRKILDQTLEAAALVGAAGVVVHGGHAEDGVDEGFGRWRTVFERLQSDVPVLIENTAGGTNAMTRHVDTIAQLWEYLEGFDVGFCFDTCHAHAAGEDLGDVIQRVLDATGRIDLVHANGSRDKAGSGADRHANFAAGQLEPGVIVELVRAAGDVPIICETPWPGIAEDIALLRAEI